MTLEDFFTLTEMRDGLSSLARVGELLLVIQNLKDPDENDVVDAFRQWSTVASTLAVTKNEECLNQFLSLNGDSFLNKWLQKALNFSEDAGGNVVEELINSLLESFEKLPINIERANASGIVITIKHLLGHKCLQIKDKARFLLDKWNLETDDNGGDTDMVTEDASQKEETKTFEDTQMFDISQCNKSNKETCERNNVNMESQLLSKNMESQLLSKNMESQLSDGTRCLDSSKPDSEKNEIIYTSNLILSSTSSNYVNATAALGDTDSSGPSLVSNCNKESSSIVKDSSAAAYASGVTCISHSSMEGATDGKPEELLLKDVTLSMKEEGMVPLKSDQNEIHGSFSSSTPSVSESVQMAAVGPVLSSYLDPKRTESCLAKTAEPQSKDGLNSHVEDCSTMEEPKSVDNVPESNEDILGIGRVDATDGSQSCHNMEAVKTVGATKEFTYQSDSKKVIKRDVMSTKSFKTSEGKCIDGMGQKSEFGIIDDALEVARQVAIAVEREVVDYREPFCSSPEANSMEAGDDCSPDSNDNERDQTASQEVDLAGSPSENEVHSGSESSTKEASDITQNTSSDMEKSGQDIESPKPNTIQESIGKSNREKCVLDLNADIQSDELESLMKPIPDIPVLSTPLPIVASSKGSPVLPVIPLHFEGVLGWKGTAATSAFRPASPRKTPESENTRSGSRQNSSNFLDIDLNVAESDAEVVVEPILTRHLPASAELPSGDSSMEVSSIKAEKLKLDLNRLVDEDVPTYMSSCSKIQHQNVEQSLSSASSSSARQFSVRDFDLNDNPNFIDTVGSHYFDKSSSKSSSRYGGLKHDDPVISLMSSTMPPERKGFSNQLQQSFLSNGVNMDPSAGTRPGLPYDKLPPGIYSYSGCPSGPGISMPQPFYTPGSIPYMVSSGGPTVFPQVTSSGGFNGAPSARPSLLLTTTNAPLSSFGFEAPRAGFDLNSGSTSGDTGNQGGGLKQFFWQGHGGFVDPQTKEPSSSTVTAKRKEPECGWDSYPFGYKHMTS